MHKITLIPTANGATNELRQGRFMADLVQAIVSGEVEVWSGCGGESWLPRPVPEKPGSLLARAGALQSGTSLRDLYARWVGEAPVDWQERLAAIRGEIVEAWGEAAAVEFEGPITASSNVTALTETPLGAERWAHIHFPRCRQLTSGVMEFLDVVRNTALWNEHGFNTDTGVPHHRWKRRDPRTSLSAGLMLSLLSSLCDGCAYLKVLEQIDPCDINQEGAARFVAVESPGYTQWMMCDGSGEHALKPRLRGILETLASGSQTFGPDRRWILAVVAAQPLVWFALAEEIDAAVSEWPLPRRRWLF